MSITGPVRVPVFETSRLRRVVLRSATVALVALVLGTVAAGVAAGQTNTTGGGVAASFCETSMAATIKNLFRLIQLGGALIGGVLALGATVLLPLTGRSDRKREMKQIRNQGLLWGVLVAPLGTEIVQFLLNDIIVGGSSCAF